MNNPFIELFQGAKKYSCDKGQVLVSPNDEPRGVHFIHSGYVKTYDISTNGEYQVVAMSGPGDIFPLYWALDNEPRQLFYETMCPTEISILAKHDFKLQVEQSNQLLRAALEVVLKAFHHSQERIQNLELRTAREQIAFRLLFLGKHFGHKKGKQIDVDVPITYQDVAESLNLTRETVNRTMLQLISSGMVARTDHHVVINSPQALQDILGDESTLDI